MAYYFNRQFESMHSMSVDQALGGWWKLNRKIMPPHEAKKIMDEHSDIFGTYDEHLEHVNKMVGEDTTEEALHTWQKNHVNFLVGSPYRSAAHLRDLTKLIKSHGEPNPVTLYRGSSYSPQDFKKRAPDQFTSATTDKSVAEMHARAERWNNKNAKVHAIKPGTVRAVNLSQFGGLPMTVGRTRRKEQEWLIDPESVQD